MISKAILRPPNLSRQTAGHGRHLQSSASHLGNSVQTHRLISLTEPHRKQKPLISLLFCLRAFSEAVGDCPAQKSREVKVVRAILI